ncbi:hypothetical protein AXI59_14295 [Bacillus nakamurai]|uniref:Uncharacterized protein n=1 Tax=Bacillus nakamurai TaxID=1793963 RepID=A0A150F6Q8_9BACI|nr:hypothetical protein [Bacillus nakamurai]KXZ17122.1 hypothetical protein AXI58_01645 [Bacillus nakamurai]KXZ20597.1 hypothetical protein AXI59_14295 [Bacillus nakamurai]MED1228928.1 hypothetical protein [Bacillus nakamurai]
MKSDHYLNLQPLKFLDGWTVELNHLNSQKNSKETVLLSLNNEKRNAAVEVLYQNSQYHVKVTDSQKKETWAEDSTLDIESLVVKLESVIWNVGSGILDNLKPFIQDPPNLLRLKIPEGWTIDYNTLKDTNPKTLGAEDEAWLFDFNQDLLQISHKTKNLLLDVGWYPEGDPTGSYGIELIKNEDWEHPLEDVMCEEPNELVKQLDRIFMKELNNEY